jgi:hypothetical protein
MFAFVFRMDIDSVLKPFDDEHKYLRKSLFHCCLSELLP